MNQIKELLSQWLNRFKPKIDLGLSDWHRGRNTSRTRAHPKRLWRPGRSWTISPSCMALSTGSASALQTPAPISTATPTLIYHRSRDRQHICARVRQEGRRDNGVSGRGKSRRKYGSREDWDRTFGEAFQGSYFVWRASSYPSRDPSLSPPFPLPPPP